jgi:DNA-binding response OmpR family regulator
LAELSARIRAVSRRHGTVPEAISERGLLRIDPNRQLVTYNGAAVQLTSTEFAVLQTLMRSPLQVFSHQMLREKTRSFRDEGERDSIRTHIANLRRKFRLAGAMRDPIENVYGIGYRLAELDS